MNRAYAVLGVVSTLAVGAMAYAHIAQRQQKARMHQGVLRDIEREKAEAAAAAATAAGTGGVECVNGVCDLSATRFRDPVTGKVYDPKAA